MTSLPWCASDGLGRLTHCDFIQPPATNTAYPQIHAMDKTLSSKIVDYQVKEPDPVSIEEEDSAGETPKLSDRKIVLDQTSATLDSNTGNVEIVTLPVGKPNLKALHERVLHK